MVPPRMCMHVQIAGRYCQASVAGEDAVRQSPAGHCCRHDSAMPPAGVLSVGGRMVSQAQRQRGRNRSHPL